MNELQVTDWLRRLLRHFDIEHGHPSTYGYTDDGVAHIMVNDDLAILLEDGLEILEEFGHNLLDEDEEEDLI